MSFAAGSDEEEYRAFIVKNWPLFAKPDKDEEKLVENDDAENFQSYLAQVDTNEELKKQLVDEGLLYRYFAIASRYGSKKCFKLIVDAMVQHINLWNKALIVSILLFHRYAKGMELLYTHGGIKEKRIFDIETVFESKGFLHTEGNAKKNTILGIIAYGRLSEDLLEMAQSALNLGAEMTKNGEYVRSPLVNAIQSGNYRIHSLFAKKDLSAFTYKSDSRSKEVSDALKSAFDHKDIRLLRWISDICLGNAAGLLPDKSPTRPSSSLPVSTVGTKFMTLSQLLKRNFLNPGDLVEAKIDRIRGALTHFMVYVGECGGKNDAIVHKNGAFSSEDDNVIFDHMTPHNEKSKIEWRRAPLFKAPLPFLSRGSNKTRPPIDVIFNAIQNIEVCNYDLLRENCEHFANEGKCKIVKNEQQALVAKGGYCALM